MRKKVTNGASYLTIGKSSPKAAYSNNPSSKIYSLFAAFLAILILFLSIIVSTGNSNIAFADSEDTLNKAAESFGVEKTPEGFEKALAKANNENKKSEPDNTSFAYVFSRLLGTGYLNHTPDGVAPKGHSKRAKNCNPKTKSSILYHNCDVPNIMTEFLQDTVSVFIPSGALNAEVNSNTLNASWFGLPSNIPNQKVPVKDSEKSAKFTALELYGYNLKYTRYLGEWDHIKVFTSARALSNFGFMDSVKLGANAVFDGLKGSMTTSWSSAVEGWNTGGLLNAIGGAFSGFVTGGSASTINTVLDTSDLNVFNMNSWYRVNFSNTLYGARELSETELAAVAQQAFFDMISSELPDEASLPKEFLNIKTGPARPLEDISSCVINSREYGPSTAPGITETDCVNIAQNLATTKPIYDDEGNQIGEEEVVPEVKWSINGQQKGETISEWKKSNKLLFTTAVDYNITCDLGELPIGNRENEIDSFYSCWSQQWNAESAPLLQDSADSNARDFIKKMENPEEMQKFLTENGGRNFNAPTSRYVCVNPKTGKDLRDGNGSNIYLYDQNGKKNSECSDVRPPIQNGFFGNGYTGNDANNPALTDTRYSTFKNDIFGNMFAILGIGDLISEAGMNLTIIITRITNTLLNLTFSPILGTLGLDKIVISLVKSFTSGVFMPLSVIAIALSALLTVIKFGKRGDFTSAIKSLGFTILVFLTSIVLLARPAETIKAIEYVPSQIETAIMGSIFTLGEGEQDQLCTATGTPKVKPAKDFDGNNLDYSPDAAARQMMCEVWRTFAFTPWVYGQWGTSYSNLYAETTKQENKLKNTNTELVGNAKVSMGGQKSVYNWALYQLKVTSSGTSTTKDLSRSTGFVDPNFYRIVDAQAGPNNGAGTDSTYFNNWTGNAFGSREMVSLLSVVAAIFGLIAIGTFAFTKIQISAAMTMLILFMPIMALVGLFDGQGRSKFKGYIGDILGLILQRILLIAIIAVMLRVITTTAGGTTGYTAVFLMTIAVTGFFIMYKKEIIKMIESIFGAQLGSLNSPITSAPLQTIAQSAPKSVQNYAQRYATGAYAGTAGAIGGLITKGPKGAVEGFKNASRLETNKKFNAQRRLGLGIAESMIGGASRAKNEHLRDLKRSDAHYDASTYYGIDKAFERRKTNELETFGNPEISRLLTKIDSINNTVDKIDKDFIDTVHDNDKNRIELIKAKGSEAKMDPHGINQLVSEFQEKAKERDILNISEDKVYVLKDKKELHNMNLKEREEYVKERDEKLADGSIIVISKSDDELRKKQIANKISLLEEKDNYLKDISLIENKHFAYEELPDIKINDKDRLDYFRQQIQYVEHDTKDEESEDE